MLSEESQPQKTTLKNSQKYKIMKIENRLVVAKSEMVAGGLGVTKCNSRVIFVVIELCDILIAVVVTQIYIGDKMVWDYAYTLYQCQFPGFDTVLQLCKM